MADSIDFIYNVVIYSVQKKKLAVSSEGGGVTGDYYTLGLIKICNDCHIT